MIRIQHVHVTGSNSPAVTLLAIGRNLYNKTVEGRIITQTTVNLQPWIVGSGEGI